MLDDWFRTIELGISLEEFNSLPRHAAYKYEYLGGSAWLTPDPRYGRALLDLASIAPPAAPDQHPAVWRTSPGVPSPMPTGVDWPA